MSIDDLWNIEKYVLLCKSYVWKKSLKIKFMVKNHNKNHNIDSFVRCHDCHLLGNLILFNMIPHAWQELVLFSHNDHLCTTYDSPGGHFEKWLPFFPAAYRQGRPHRSGAGMSPEHAHTQEPFTTAHVSKPMETWVLPPGYKVWF